MTISLEQLAETVDEAARTGTAIAQLTDVHPDLDAAAGYAVQRLSIQRRLNRGERRIGIKMGLTSRAKMRQVGVAEVIWGRLTDAMRIEEGGEIALVGRVHPRVEPEIAFLLKKPLCGRVSPAEALAAVEAVAPAMEIIDSRYRDFKFNFADVVADNASSSGLILGAPRPAGTDIANLGMVMRFAGQPVQVGSSSAILGHPLRSLVAAARLVAVAEETLSPGDIVLAGAATEAVALRPGQHVRTDIQGLGSVSFIVRGEVP
nr:fumarylacetoacetate hydrolase family protein [uncultured Azospirillum sp.]